MGTCVNHEERTTLSGRLPETLDAGAPAPIDPATGMHRDYWVLSAAERAKGFVRQVRTRYQHVGIPGPKHLLRNLTDDEMGLYAGCHYVKFEVYPESEAPVMGRFWTQAQLESIGAGCGMVTTMGRVLAETYAREPDFYGATFCCNCRKHLPVGAVGEFVWAGTNERVGT